MERGNEHEYENNHENDGENNYESKNEIKGGGCFGRCTGFYGGSTDCVRNEGGRNTRGSGAGAGMGMASETVGSEGDGECQEEGRMVEVV